MTARLTILGCGSSGGVPRVGGDWGKCDPNEQKNRRRRCSVLVTRQGPGGATQLLIDTSPDMRDQMLSANVQHLDGVWYTHEHADHTHGIDELRGYFLRQGKRIPVWADGATASMLRTRFGYCFVQQPGSDYPPILEMHTMSRDEHMLLHGAGGSISAQAFPLQHGNIVALGFRIGKVAYTPDVNGIPDSSLPFLENLDTWVVDALRRTRHPSHFSLPETLEWIARLKPRQAVITNLHVDLDYATLTKELPPHVVPAFDGMTIPIALD